MKIKGVGIHVLKDSTLRRMLSEHAAAGYGRGFEVGKRFGDRQLKELLRINAKLMQRIGELRQRR